MTSAVGLPRPSPGSQSNHHPTSSPIVSPTAAIEPQSAAAPGPPHAWGSRPQASSWGTLAHSRASSSHIPEQALANSEGNHSPTTTHSPPSVPPSTTTWPTPSQHADGEALPTGPTAAAPTAAAATAAPQTAPSPTSDDATRPTPPAQQLPSSAHLTPLPTPTATSPLPLSADAPQPPLSASTHPFPHGVMPLPTPPAPHPHSAALLLSALAAAMTSPRPPAPSFSPTDGPFVTVALPVPTPFTSARASFPYPFPLPTPTRTRALAHPPPAPLPADPLPPTHASPAPPRPNASSCPPPLAFPQPGQPQPAQPPPQNSTTSATGSHDRPTAASTSTKTTAAAPGGPLSAATFALMPWLHFNIIPLPGQHLPYLELPPLPVPAAPPATWCPPFEVRSQQGCGFRPIIMVLSPQCPVLSISTIVRTGFSTGFRVGSVYLAPPIRGALSTGRLASGPSCCCLPNAPFSVSAQQ